MLKISCDGQGVEDMVVGYWLWIEFTSSVVAGSLTYSIVSDFYLEFVMDSSMPQR